MQMHQSMVTTAPLVMQMHHLTVMSGTPSPYPARRSNPPPVAAYQLFAGSAQTPRAPNGGWVRV